MKKRLFVFIIVFLLVMCFPFNFVSAWSRGTHDYSCPENYSIDCKVADYFEFQKNNHYANTIYHVCYDNKEDCISRLTAKYFLKKYYIGGKTDQELIGAAAHLLQDASCPAHWYPGFKILGKDTYIFAPRWVEDIEWKVNSELENHKENWGIGITYKGKKISINEDFLNNLKKEISGTILKEPQESLENIESQIKSKIKWHYLRAYQSFIIILFVLIVPFFGYGLWKYKKRKKKSLNLIITGIVIIILSLLFILIKIFY